MDLTACIQWLCGALLQVSYTFCRDFMQLLLKDAGITEIGSTEFGRTEILVKSLQRVSVRRARGGVSPGAGQSMGGSAEGGRGQSRGGVSPCGGAVLREGGVRPGGGQYRAQEGSSSQTVRGGTHC